jgi:SAM-dependent methyltransferase
VILKCGQPALDVGCGTGRLLLDYLGAGIDIDGVDNSPEMLQICREKAEALGLQPRLYEQNMQELDLPRSYGTIIVPSSSFQLLTNPDDAAEAMWRFFRHLVPAGTLVMPFMILWTEPTEEDVVTVDWRCTAETVRPEDGATVRIWSRNRYDLRRQLEDTEDRFEVVRDGQIVASECVSKSPATCWYTQEEARELYAGAGFTNIRLTSEFTFAPTAKEDRIFCVFGTR